MSRLRPILVASILLAAPRMALAHPGHGSDAASWSVLHYLIEPEHLLAVVSAVGLLAGALLLLLRHVRGARLHPSRKSR